MTRGGGRSTARALALLMLALSGGGAVAEEGNVFSNLFRYGGTTVPPSQAKELEPAYCPPIDVAEGGAALKTGGEAGSVRSQITLGRLARECARLADGSVSVKVGIEARVLLGPAGAPGRFEVPLTIAIKHEGKTVATRAKRVAAVIAPGEAQTFATLVEEGLIVPPALSADYDIEVGLGGARAAKPAKPKPRRKPASEATSEAPSGASTAEPAPE